MFGKRKLTGALAFVASTAIALAVAAPAWAADAATTDPITQDPEITKTVVANSSIDITKTTFTYTFTQVDYADGGTSATDDAVAVTGVTITPDANITGTGTQTTFTKNITLPTTFPHAGIYKYTLKETQPNPNPTVDGITYSKAEYVMYIYVDNTTNNTGADKELTVVSKVTFVKTKDDAGSAVTDTTKAAPNFTNTFAPVSDLKVSKEVTGNYGDKTKEFTIPVTITIPGNATEPETGYTYTITKRDGTPSTGNIKSGTEVKFTLADGEYVTFADVPVGTTYVVTEGAEDNYTATAAVAATNNAEQAISDTATGTKGAGLTADNFSDAEDAAVVGPKTGYANNTVVTNDYTPVTPTGILISNLPYILLIGIPVAALVAWLVIRGKRYSQAA